MRMHWHDHYHQLGAKEITVHFDKLLHVFFARVVTSRHILRLVLRIWL